MTTLYGTRNEAAIVFNTNDDYPYVTDKIDGVPFHVFRSAELDSDPQVLMYILAFAINFISDTDGINYKPDHVDIISHKCKNVEFMDHKITLFESFNSLVAISTLSP